MKQFLLGVAVTLAAFYLLVASPVLGQEAEEQQPCPFVVQAPPRVHTPYEPRVLMDADQRDRV